MTQKKLTWQKTHKKDLWPWKFLLENSSIFYTLMKLTDQKRELISFNKLCWPLWGEGIDRVPSQQKGRYMIIMIYAYIAQAFEQPEMSTKCKVKGVLLKNKTPGCLFRKENGKPCFFQKCASSFFHCPYLTPPCTKQVFNAKSAWSLSKLVEIEATCRFRELVVVVVACHPAKCNQGPSL